MLSRERAGGAQKLTKSLVAWRSNARLRVEDSGKKLGVRSLSSRKTWASGRWRQALGAESPNDWPLVKWLGRLSQSTGQMIGPAGPQHGSASGDPWSKLAEHLTAGPIPAQDELAAAFGPTSSAAPISAAPAH